MDTRIRSSSALALIVIIFLAVSLCSNFAESRPSRSRLSAALLDSFPSEIPGSYFDYDYPDIELPQGPRYRRWAFPVDVQDSLCPPGQRQHSSGYGCVSDEGDDY